MKNDSVRFILGISICVFAFLLEMYFTINRIKTYNENQIDTPIATFGVVTKVEKDIQNPNKQTIRIKYDAYGNEHFGNAEFNDDIEIDNFVKVFYSAYNPDIFTLYDSKNGKLGIAIFIIVDFVIVVATIFSIYMRISFKNNSVIEELELIGADENKLVFKEKGEDKEKDNIYFYPNCFEQSNLEDIVKADIIQKSEVIKSTKFNWYWKINIETKEEE